MQHAGKTAGSSQPSPSQNQLHRRRTLRRRRRANSGFTILEILIAVSIFGIIINMAAPSLKVARYKSQGRSCTANMRRIAYAKNSYSLEKNIPLSAPESVFTDAVLYGPGTYLKKKPVCPNAGVYSVGDGATDPSCNYGGGTLHTFTGAEVYSTPGSGKY